MYVETKGMVNSSQVGYRPSWISQQTEEIHLGESWLGMSPRNSFRKYWVVMIRRKKKRYYDHAWRKHRDLLCNYTSKGMSSADLTVIITRLVENEKIQHMHVKMVICNLE